MGTMSLMGIKEIMDIKMQIYEFEPQVTMSYV